MPCTTSCAGKVGADGRRASLWGASESMQSASLSHLLSHAPHILLWTVWLLSLSTQLQLIIQLAQQFPYGPAKAGGHSTFLCLCSICSIYAQTANAEEGEMCAARVFG